MANFDWLRGEGTIPDIPAPAPDPDPAPPADANGAPEPMPVSEPAPEPERGHDGTDAPAPASAAPAPAAAKRTRNRTRAKTGPSRRDIERILNIADQVEDTDYAALVDELTGSDDRAGRVEKILEGRWRQPVEDAERIAAAGGDMARFKETLRLHDRNPERLKAVVRLLGALTADPDVKWGGNELDVAETVARIIPDADLTRVQGLK